MKLCQSAEQSQKNAQFESFLKIALSLLLALEIWASAKGRDLYKENEKQE